MYRRFTLCLFALLAQTVAGLGCTIFIANDGQHIWVGNNEDELQNKKYRFWYYPSAKGSHGYMLWSELPGNKLAYGLMYKFPQGGLNEHGLFMDYTAIEAISPTDNPAKATRKKQVVTDILKTCQTVEQALAFINQFNLPKLTSAQLFIADASGNYATVTGGYVVQKTAPSFALTNYRINEGHTEACHRRDVATHYLSTLKTFDLEAVRQILAKSSQKQPNNLITNYSMAVDLKTAMIHLYQKGDFSETAFISLRNELSQGRHHHDLATYFPQSVATMLQRTYARSGLDAALEQYKQLRSSADTRYNFKNDDAMNVAVQWIEQNKLTEAIGLLTTLTRFDTDNAHLHAWLGVAYRRANNPEQSVLHFDKALALQPDNYVATLFGKQQSGKITFKLPDFERAEQVSLIGAFTEGRKKAIRLTKNDTYWLCEVTLPPGEYTYKLLVDDKAWADSKNRLHEGDGPNVFSKFYVWP